MPLDEADVTVGPGSTFAFAAVANELKVQTAVLLAERGSLPPVLTSSSVVGEERSTELFDTAYAEHASRLANVIDPDQR